MKLAHLILTHANPQQVNRLINRLVHENAHFYIHVDKKTAIEPFVSLLKQNNVFFIKNRIKVYWGGYSIVQATINSFEEILASGIVYDYINLLSGQDYPLKSTAHIHQFLSNNKGKAFMHFLSVEDEWKEAITRVTKYHLANFHFPGQYKIENLINKIMPIRKLPHSLIAVGRSQWFTILPECAAFIIEYLKHDLSVRRFFKLSWAPDEMIFQTILYNSHFQKNMVNNNLLYVDWSMGGASPKVLTMADAPLLAKSDKLFARKFNPSVDEKILDYLDDIAPLTVF